MSAKSDDCPPWLATFADLMSLLMAVFVLLFAMSTLDAKKYEAVVQSLTYTLGHGSDMSQTQVEYFKTAELEQADLDEKGETVIEDLKPLFESMVDTYAISNQDSDIQVTLDKEQKQIKVTFAESISFLTGEAKLKPGFITELERLQPYINDQTQVKAIGHTDKRPVSGGRFKSNWELSSARAAAVIELLVSEGIAMPEQVEVIGVADSRPIDPGDNLEAYQKNRRVEIILVPNQALETGDLSIEKIDKNTSDF